MKKTVIISFPFAIVFALISNVISTHNVSVFSLCDFPIFIFKVLLFSGMIVITENMVKIIGKRSLINIPFDFSWNINSILKLTVVMSLVYILYLVVFYPGVCNYDTSNEITDLITGETPLPYSWISGQVEVSALMNDHHPVFDTIIFTGFYKIGDILGRKNLGIFLYCFVQIVLTSFSFSVMLCSMSRWNAKLKTVQQAGLLFLVLAPFIPMYVICMVKDSLFAFLFVLYLTVYLLIILDETNRKYLVGILILSILLSLTKKTGLYQVLITNAALFLLKTVRKNWKTITIVALSELLPILIMIIILPHLLFPMFNIYPGGKQESMGFMLQQVSRVVYDHEEELSEEDKEVINSVINISDIKEHYLYDSIDGVKDRYNFYATDDEISEFKKLWIRQGLKHPLSYFVATFEVSGYFFVPSREISVYNAFVPNGFGVNNPEQLRVYRDSFTSFYKFLCAFPGINVLFSMALYTSLLPIVLVIRIIRDKDLKKLLCFIPILLCILILIICPIAYGRYSLVNLYTIPFVLGLTCIPKGGISING